MSMLDRLDRGDLVGTRWTEVKDDYVRSGLLRLNSNQFMAGAFRMPWSWMREFFWRVFWRVE
jgi:hypothetical protein